MTAEDEGLAGTDSDAAVVRRARWPWIVLAILLLVLVALGIVWLDRKQIASRVIDRTLAEKHVPARYHIADLGLGRQRLTDLVIGDPAHPDLVADWVEVNTTYGLHGVHVYAIRAGHVRVRGKLVDGHLSLGAIDRLLPPPSGKPFSLPDIRLAVADGRMRLDTPYGLVGLKLSGNGRLTDGFAGDVAAITPGLDLGSCAIGRASAVVSVRIADRQPHITGPVRAATAQCGDTSVADAHIDLDVGLSERLDRWKGEANAAIGRLATPQAMLADTKARARFDGSALRTAGTIEVTSHRFATPALAGQGLALSGGYRVEPEFQAFQGMVSVDRTQLSHTTIARVAQVGGAAPGTPVAPLLDRLARAAARAGSAFGGSANVAVMRAHDSGQATISRMILNARSGASAALSGGDGVLYAWPTSGPAAGPAAGLRIDGTLALSGGGLPDLSVRLHQPHPGAPIEGIATLAPYEAPGARLALTPVRFSASPDGATRFATQATLSGPLADGRVDRLTLPLTGRWNGASGLVLDPTCVPLTWRSVRVSGLALDPAQLRLCPTARALVSVDGGHVSGGAAFSAAHLTGRIGSTPIDLAARGTRLTLADRAFHLDDLQARLGPADKATRLGFGTLDGRIDAAGVGGTFAGGDGQIANVPLLISGAGGTWSLHDGVLAMAGGLSLSDAAQSARFKPLGSKDFTLRLADNVITAQATFAEPTHQVTVVDADIVHDLASGAGHADLNVPGLTFTKDFQPELVTPLTFGVIASVRGTVNGVGHIAWDANRVTSTGTFGTTDTDLAAAFGPVTGLSTQIHFTDLLNLTSAPHQVATVASINPGVAAENGVIHYQTLDSQHVRVEDGYWPFAGGSLSLAPTTLDFTGATAKRLTFTIKGMNAGQFLQQFDFKNLDATGVFDGTLPMVFDDAGGRIEGGHLDSRSGGTIAYVGDLSQKDLGFWGNMAFQALKSLTYDKLGIVMNGPLAGEMVTEVHFGGVHQGKGASSNFLIRRLAKLPFIFNIRIRAPFRGLIDSAASFYDPKRLIERNLPALLQQQEQQEKQGGKPAPGQPQVPAPPPAPSTSSGAADRRAVQPPESETVP